MKNFFTNTSFKKDVNVNSNEELIFYQIYNWWIWPKMENLEFIIVLKPKGTNNKASKFILSWHKIRQYGLIQIPLFSHFVPQWKWNRILLEIYKRLKRTVNINIPFDSMKESQNKKWKNSLEPNSPWLLFLTGWVEL